MPNLRKQLDVALIANSAVRGMRLAEAGAAIAEQAARAEEQRLRLEHDIERRKQLSAEAVAFLETIFTELEAVIMREVPNAVAEHSAIGPPLKRIRLGHAYVEYGVPYLIFGGVVRPFGAGRLVGSEAWDVLAGGYIGVAGYGGPPRGRSANLWFGQLLDGDDYRAWEVSYCDASDVPPDSLHRHTEPFGAYRDLNFRPLSNALVARDPQPVTPDFTDAFIERWIGLFAQAATASGPEMDKLFPRKFERQPVSPAFKLDRP